MLVVDDDPSIVNMLKEDLLAEGHNVSCGYDGQMAVRIARETHPDLIIMDVFMPLTNGIKALEYLRSFPETSTIPVIFISGELSQDVYPHIHNVPRVAHLKKPLDLESLNSFVKQFAGLYPVA